MIIGKAIRKPDFKKGMKAPSLMILMARRGIHEMIDVLRIINETDNIAVSMIVLRSNLFF